MKDTVYGPMVLGYLERLYGEGKRRYSCRAKNSDEFSDWQFEAREELRRLLGLTRIERENIKHEVKVELEEPEELDGYTKQRGSIVTEPYVTIRFWLLRPDGRGPHPLGIFPHGHADFGMNSYAGVFRDREHREHVNRQDRDVAVQAVKRGYLAIAPNTRGFRPAAVPDISKRHGGRDCRSQLIHCILGGRTPVGERVWDVQNLINWATGMEDVDPERILVMGNSGGGVVTIYTAACDQRVKVAVPSCSFCTIVGRNGMVHHCDCNSVPGIMTFGELYDVAGLIAPRHLCVVNGKKDSLFPVSEVDRAVKELRRIYDVAGVPDRFRHSYGEGGHRFYSDLMWPFIEDARC